MKSCPWCKHIVMFYYNKYRCGYCSIWLDPNEVLSNVSDRALVPEDADSVLVEAQRHLAGNHAADKSSEQVPVGQNISIELF